MEAQVPARYVWRFLLRRVWTRSSHGIIRKVWRKVWRRVSQTDAHFPSRRDIRSITYADCEAFFEIVSKGSKKKLVEMFYDTHGPDVTIELAKCYNEDGETPLLMAIRQGKLEIVKYLTQKLKVAFNQYGQLVWKGVTYSEAPPLFAAILYGQMDIVKFLIAAEMQAGQTFTSIRSIALGSNDQQQKIDILELLGAAYLCFHRLDRTRSYGFLCWRVAISLRRSPTNSWQEIPKAQVIFMSEEAHKAVGCRIEFTSAEQLHQLYASDLELYTQSVLVSQRILGELSVVANLFIDAQWCQYIDMCHKEEDHSRVICAALVAFEYYQHRLKDLDCKIASRIISSATNSFKKLWCFGQLRNEKELTFANLMKTFQFATCYTTHLQNDEKQFLRLGTLYNLARITLEIILLIVEILPQFNADAVHQFKCCLYRFIRMDHRFGYYNHNLLHLICACKHPYSLGRPIGLDDHGDDDEENSSSSSDSDGEAIDTDGSASGCSTCGNYSDCSPENDDFDVVSIGDEEEEVDVLDMVEIPSTQLQMSVIKLFLEVGADPNSTNVLRLTPLHLLAEHSDDFGPAQLVIEHGGHVDQVDMVGRSPLMFFKERLDEDPKNIDPRLQILINNVRPLSCLSAQALRNHQVTFNEEIPAALYSFVNCH